MKQEDLKSLKIEDLEEVTYGYWPDGEEMIVSHCHFIENHDDIQIKNVFAFVKGANNPVITKDKDGIIACVNKAYKIPQPKMRDMNSLEVMEYLHLLQLVLNNCEKTFIFPIEIDKMHKGVVVFNEPEFNNDWSNSAQLSSDIDDRIFKFGILKNGITTEFKLPQIEA